VNLGLTAPEWWTKLGLWARDEWERLFAVIQAWSSKEHNNDGTHGDVTFTSLTGTNTALSVGLQDGSVSRPSLYFLTHSEGASGGPRLARAWPGFYMRSATYPAEWAYTSTDIDGDAFGPLFSISALGIVPLVSGLVLGGATAGSIVSEQLWGTVATQDLYEQRRFGYSLTFTTTGTVDDAALGQATRSVLRWNGASNLTVRGMAAPSPTDPGQWLTVFNVSANTLTFNHEDVASTAANRILTATGAAVALGANDSGTFWYDTTSARWRMANREA